MQLENLMFFKSGEFFNYDFGFNWEENERKEK